MTNFKLILIKRKENRKGIKNIFTGCKEGRNMVTGTEKWKINQNRRRSK